MKVPASAPNPAPGALIPVPSLPNLRDLGGWPCPGGQVSRGLVYRSTDLSRLTDVDTRRVLGLGVQTVLDLRTAAERAEAPDRSLDGVQEVVADVLGDSPGAAPAQVLGVLTDPDKATQLLGGGRGVALFEKGYRAIVSSPSALDAYHVFFTRIAQDSSRPVLFHCTTGKDRTGWGAATLLMLLGVSADDVMTDYLLTNEQLLPALKSIMDRFSEAGGDPRLLRPVLGVEPEYLQIALDEMTKTFGSIGGYLEQGLRLEPATLASLRSGLVDRG